MLKTKNGTVEGIPSTSMLKQEELWRYLLVCEVSKDNTPEALETLFQTDFVEDDNGIKWLYTQFIKIAEDNNKYYVWLTYTDTVKIDEQYEPALNELGVVTESAE